MLLSYNVLTKTQIDRNMENEAVPDLHLHNIFSLILHVERANEVTAYLRELPCISMLSLQNNRQTKT